MTRYLASKFFGGPMIAYVWTDIVWRFTRFSRNQSEHFENGQPIAIICEI